MSRYVMLFALALASAGCSKDGSHPTAPTPPPDNPNSPAITASATWTPSPATIVLTAPSEDFAVTSLAVSTWQTNAGGVALNTDMPYGTVLHQGQPLTVHTTTDQQTGRPYVWRTGDHHLVRVNGHRPGQTTMFSVHVYSD